MKRVLLCWMAVLWLCLPTLPVRAEPPRSNPCPASPEELATAAQAPIDLNRAGESELVRLPGIGPSRARAILAFRESHGGFRSVNQLLRIKGIGRAMLRRLKPLVVVGTAVHEPSEAASSKVMR